MPAESRPDVAECDAIYSESWRGHAVAKRDGAYAALPAALQHRPHIPRLKIVCRGSISLVCNSTPDELGGDRTAEYAPPHSMHEL